MSLHIILLFSQLLLNFPQLQQLRTLFKLLLSFTIALSLFLYYHKITNCLSCLSAISASILSISLLN